MRRLVVAGALALALAACSNLPGVPTGTCGNGVVEPDQGEDCDQAGARCGAPDTSGACRLLCDPAAADGCPDGAACGHDGVCHAPGGGLEVTASRVWTSRHLLVGDTTGDGFPELVGVGDSELEILIGGPDGAFSSSVVLPNLAVIDVPRIADVDGDGSADVLIPVGIGLYTLVGDPLATLQPILQDSFHLPTTGPMVVTSVQFTTGAGQNTYPTTVTLAALHLDQGPDCGLAGGCDAVLLGDGAAAWPLGRKVEHLIQNEIPWARAPGGPDRMILAALAFADDPSTVPDESGVFLFRGDAGAETLTAAGQVTGLPGKVARGAWFADLDRDARAELLVSVAGGLFGDAIMVAWARADGTFDPPTYLIGGPGPTQATTDAIAWADLDADAAADLIAESGVYFASCIGRSCTFIAGSSQDHGWRGAVVADLNGDGRRDVGAFTSGGSILDVLLGTGTRGFWNAAPLTAPGEIAAMRTGDFDGNGVADLAIVSSPFDLVDADRLHVAFGRRNEPPSPAVYMGFIGDAVALDRSLTPLPGRLDTIDDLLVVSQRTGTRGAAIVLGSTSKRMVAPLIPAVTGGGFNLVEATVALSLDGDDFDDVVCLATGIDDDGGFAGSTLRVYTSDAAGTLTERTPMGGVPVSMMGFLLREALWAAIPGAGGEPAMIVGVDAIGRMISVEVRCTATGCTSATPRVLLAGTEIGEPTALRATDLDGDGRLDVLATFRGNMREPGAAMVWHNRGGDLGAPQTLAPLAGLVYVDIAGVDLDLDGVASLYLVARGDLAGGSGSGGVFVSSPDGGGTYPAPVRAAALDAVAGVDKGITLHGGDLNGDGLADLALTSGTDRATPRAIAVVTQRERAGGIAGR